LDGLGSGDEVNVQTMKRRIPEPVLAAVGTMRSLRDGA
jgi:hypothetical protein